MRKFLMTLFVLAAGCIYWNAQAGAGEGIERPIRTYNKGIPVKSYGDTFILTQPPDLLTGVKLQKDNDNPITKIRLKKPSEIKENWIGGANPHMPRTEMMDRWQNPYLPINLIDEDTETYWTSRGQPVPNMEEEWIRIDLPQEVWVKEVAIKRRTRPNRNSWQIGNPPGVRSAGDGIPRHLTIKVSQDALNWTTIAEKKNYEPKDEEKRLSFPLEQPRPVKQVWILGKDLHPVDCWGFCFSVADVEVIDTAGNNYAAASHGTGITVSSTEATYTDNRDMTRNLWPTAIDLGLKWVRIAAWDSPLTWSYMEREKKGEYFLDPVTDQAVTDLAKNGVNVVLGLSFGNYLYDKPREWQKEQTDILELPNPPFEGEYRQAFMNWTRFMVRHFKDRVQYYYIWNEPYQGPPYGFGDPHKFSDFVKEVSKVIREEYPEAKLAWPTALTKGEFLEGCLADGIAPLFDLTHADMSDPAGIKARWNKAGYTADKWITYEWSSLATYPTPSKEAPYTAPDAIVSEIQKAKTVATASTGQAHNRIIMSICEWFNTYHPIWDVGLFRNTFSADPVSPTQPQPSYYVLRNMATILAETEPAEIKVETMDTTTGCQIYAFTREGKPFISIWTGSPKQKKYHDITLDTGFVMAIGTEKTGTADQVADAKTGLKFPGMRAKRVTAVDSLNGLQQDLKFHNEADGIHIDGLLVKDYPVFVEVEKE